MASTAPDSANSAMALGMTISWLNMSASSHTRSLESSDPMKMNASAMMVKGSTAFLPKSHSTFSFAKRFHERMVEKAKNSRQMATNQAPTFAPKNCPKAS